MNKSSELRVFRFAKWCTRAGMAIVLIPGAHLNAHTVGTDYELKAIPLLDKSSVIVLDHLAYDRSKDRLWVPASNTGDVDVIDSSSDAVFHVTGFSIGEVELEGSKGRLGPTAVGLGEGVVYIGNRGDSSLCVIDSQTLSRGDCVPISRSSPEMDTGPHGIVYVAATREFGAPPDPASRSKS